MPVFTITRQYLVPVYQHLVVSALSVEAACERAIASDDWPGTDQDHGNTRVATIEAIAEAQWSSPDEAPAHRQVPVPDRFSLEQQNANRAI